METLKEVMRQLAKEFGINSRQLERERQKHKDLNIWIRALKRLREEGNGTVERYKELLAEEEALKKDEPTPRKPQSYSEFVEQLKKPSPNENENCPACGYNNKIDSTPLFGQIVCPWCYAAWDANARVVLIPPPGKEKEFLGEE